jgi:hypothetical protein
MHIYLCANLLLFEKIIYFIKANGIGKIVSVRNAEYFNPR